MKSKFQVGQTQNLLLSDTVVGGENIFNLLNTAT
jgi:hypothetical protein